MLLLLQLLLLLLLLLLQVSLLLLVLFLLLLLLLLLVERNVLLQVLPLLHTYAVLLLCLSSRFYCLKVSIPIESNKQNEDNKT